jgi:hypothetical protein
MQVVLLNFTCQMTGVDVMHMCRGDGCGDGNRLVTCVGKPLGKGGALERRGHHLHTHQGEPSIVKLDDLSGMENT